MLISGTPDQVLTSSGAWAILDIGFARTSKTCGLLLPGEQSRCVQYGEARRLLTTMVGDSSEPINLVIEAPLSVAFTSSGNPTGRSVEHRPGSSRCWYFGLGCSVLVAALYLIKDLADAGTSVPVRLFEGFVSFKARSGRSSHLADVEALQQVISNPSSESVVAPADLRREPTDILESAGKLCGIDYGVPTLLRAIA